MLSIQRIFLVYENRIAFRLYMSEDGESPLASVSVFRARKFPMHSIVTFERWRITLYLH